MKAPLLALLLVAGSFAGCADAPTSGAGTDGPGPEWLFTDVDGVPHSRDAPEGNATVLFFMATWCGTCRVKAPLLAKVQADYADQGVRFYSLDFDASETPEQIRAWQEQRGQPWPHGVDPALKIQRAFGVTSQSSVVVLDAQGNVAQKWGYGGVTEQGLRSALDQVLSSDPPPA